MSRRAIALLATVALAAGMLASSPATASGPQGGYIVVFKDSVQNPGAVASEQARANGAQVSHVYRFAIKGYAASMSATAAARISRDGRVAYVEQDGVATVMHHRDGHGGGPPGPSPSPSPTEEPSPEPTEEPSPEPTEEPPPPDCGSPQVAPWGIVKVESLGSHKNGGVCVTRGGYAYIIDTGIDAGHGDLQVVRHVNFAGGPNKDCHGHGTHVAGTVAARDNTSDVIGVAPGANLVGVKVLSCSGSGSWSGVIAGVDWVTNNAIKPATANMSLGGGANTAVDDAVRNSAASGVVYAVAAGNSGADACNSSPARAGRTWTGTSWNKNNGVITVAATDPNDNEASWSNYGACVDIWAPGVSVLSTRSGGGTTTMSGTSMASPHVGGGGLLYLLSNSVTSAAAEAGLKSLATTTGKQSKDGTAIVRLHVGSL